MDCTPDMDRTVACCFDDACHSSHFGTRYNANICCSENADSHKCNATGGVPAPPPPSPRRCFARPDEGENMRLSASWSASFASAEGSIPGTCSQRASADIAEYVEERTRASESQGRWYADNLIFGAVEGCTAARAGSPQVVGNCAPPRASWQRAMYLPYENRTFLIVGNTSDTGKGTVEECHSSEGEDARMLLLACPAMSFVFSEDAADRQLRCVGGGGHFDVAAGQRRIGHSGFNVFSSSRTNMESYIVPLGAPSPTIVVAGGVTDVPMVPVRFV